MLGCHRLLEPGDGPALIFDIGGGSTELVLIDTDEGEPRIRCWWSAPWGVVSLTDSEGRNFATREERLAAYGRMRERVRHAFRHFLDLLPKGRDGIRLMGTSGTVTTLASVYLSLPSYDRRAVDGLKMPSSAMRGISETLSGMDHAERAQFPCIGHERADLGVADRGIREGILRSLMARDGHVI
jgi:exopolyphosphatase / guanosine-5'-triphosphate,3'-diphosphate pyrophosphatase